MLGNIISKLRYEKGLTQQELGDKLNVARSTIAGWETGVSEPGIDSIRSIANFFNVSCDYLLERTDERININLENSINKECLLLINNVLKNFTITKK